MKVPVFLQEHPSPYRTMIFYHSPKDFNIANPVIKRNTAKKKKRSAEFVLFFSLGLICVFCSTDLNHFCTTNLTKWTNVGPAVRKGRKKRQSLCTLTKMNTFPRKYSHFSHSIEEKKWPWQTFQLYHLYGKLGIK